MSVVIGAPTAEFETQPPLLIVGAGAAGLCAALAAKEAGVDAIVIERDARGIEKAGDVSADPCGLFGRVEPFDLCGWDLIGSRQ